MDRKIILFGAGDYGTKALKHYGAKNVEYFVDNNARKVGGFIHDKPVISVENLKEIAKDYQVVISSSYYSEIAQQLEDAGINEFSVFHPEFLMALKRLSSYYIDADKFKRIALYGIGPRSQKLIRLLLDSEFKDKIKYIADEDGGGYNGEYIEGFQVRSLPEISSDIDALIMTNEEGHFAVKGLLDKKYGHLFKVIDPFKKLALYETDEIIINRYVGKKALTEDEWIEENANSGIIKKISEYVEMVAEDVPLFEFFEIETINRCNGTCTFCPVNKRSDPRREELMSFSLYKSIVDQLAAIDYSGYFAPFSSCEPLLDERLIDFIKYAKDRLPNTHIYLYTNGTLLTLEKFEEMMLYLDELVIDNYNQNLELIKPCREIVGYIEQHPELRKKVTISMRKSDEILSSRGGDSPNRKMIVSLDDAKCALPFRHMVVQPDGKVPLCCNDPFRECTLGDLTKQSVLDVWYGEEYSRIREKISLGRGNLEKCKKCDAFLLQ